MGPPTDICRNNTPQSPLGHWGESTTTIYILPTKLCHHGIETCACATFASIKILLDDSAAS